MRKPETIERLYLDFDGFFASVEQQCDRRLRGRPVGVVPFEGTDRTAVIACSREAKAYGVKNVMPINEAKRLCPKLVLLPQKPDLYRPLSALSIGKSRTGRQAGSPSTFRWSEQEMAAGFDCRQRQQAEVTSRTATRGGGRGGGGEREGNGVRRAPRAVPSPFDAGWSGPALKCRGKGAILGSGVGTSLSARPHFLEPELDSDTH